MRVIKTKLELHITLQNIRHPPGPNPNKHTKKKRNIKAKPTIGRKTNITNRSHISSSKTRSQIIEIKHSSQATEQGVQNAKKHNLICLPSVKATYNNFQCESHLHGVWITYASIIARRETVSTRPLELKILDT